MTITNTWAIVQMDAYPELDGETPPLPWSG